ncbi:hypothetical protein [Streptacidiphilus sp. P02-A3a]|uniref:hypothetical protein n=1 Tax=Streptacidiphilus sp. P02-A3a TaxID=2704468 RepID=UPI0015F82ED1|nr:hypothetical protein [Streptacidiphilus sp. P02-A3a]QMU68615.1 hypothetical protein GXP74_10610 [Streptacidiphilus sp. P02-A3a]
MSVGREPPERVGEVGPVELTADHPSADPSADGDLADGLAPPDISTGGTDPGPAELRLGAWWRSLGRGRRRTAVALLALAVAAAFGLPALDRHPPVPPPPPPGELTDVHFLGMGAGSGQSGSEFSIRITVGDRGTAPLTIEQISQGYLGMSLAPPPGLPLTVRPERPVTLSLRATVSDCAVIPPDDAYPVLLLTVASGRATQTQAEVLGDPYILAMHSALARACQGTPGFGGPFPPTASNSGVFPP